jgi:hypothetical protein
VELASSAVSVTRAKMLRERSYSTVLPYNKIIDGSKLLRIPEDRKVQ